MQVVTEFPVQVDDLEVLRYALTVAHNHLQAVDIANATKNLADTIYSPLTLEVESALFMVKGYIEEVAIASYEQAREAEEPEEEVRELDFTKEDDDEADV